MVVPGGPSMFLNVAAGANPFGAQSGQPLLHRAFEFRLAPRNLEQS